jgi:hypothetical protein
MYDDYDTVTNFLKLNDEKWFNDKWFNDYEDKNNEAVRNEVPGQENYMYVILYKNKLIFRKGATAETNFCYHSKYYTTKRIITDDRLRVAYKKIKNEVHKRETIKHNLKNYINFNSQIKKHL